MGSRNRFARADRIKAERVTENMRAFTGEQPKGSKDKAGRRYLKSDGGTGKRVSIRNRSASTAATRKANKRYSGGVNPKVTSAGERKVLKRQGRATATRRYSGGRLVERGPGYQPITSSRFRGRESAKATNPGPTQNLQGQKEFKVGKSPVTKGRGGYAGYKHVKPGTNDPIRQVKAPKYEKAQQRSGQGRTNTTRPNAADPKRTGPNRVTGGSRTGKPISGAKSSSAGPNNTGARTTGGGRKGQISSKGGSGGGKGGFNAKLSGKKLLKKVGGVKGLARGLRGAALTSVASYLGDKYIAKPAGKYLGTKLGKAIKSRIKPGTIHPKKSQFMMGKNGEWVRRKVAGLPSGYKQSEKKVFKQTKIWKKLNRKKR